jgi:hypothetical protein|tara:strand:+ start:755 stop:1486 length:732 start_codon:yes stop_codon:yes gene_type:complete
MIETIIKEPWVKLDTIKETKDWSKQDEINWNQRHRQNENYRFFINAFDYIVCNQIHGDYLEFGCHRLRTFRMALTEARHQNVENMRFLAFDSFQGLPPSDGTHGVKYWDPGQLATSEEEFWKIIKQHGLYTENVKTIPGYYDKSLTPDLKKQLLEDSVKAAFICIDCDLYESGVSVFEFIDDFIQEGTVVYIEGWFAGYKGNPNQGLSKAFRDFEKRSKFKFVDFLNVSWMGRSFIAYKDLLL